MSQGAWTLAGIAVFAASLELPALPTFTDDPDVVAVFDVLRVVILMVGFLLAGIIFHQMRTVPKTVPPGTLVPQFRTRCLALIVGTLFVSLTIYDRIGDPVGLLFVTAVAFLVIAGISVHHAAVVPRTPVSSEEDLRAFQPPSFGAS